jgi:hypothetical protein
MSTQVLQYLLVSCLVGMALLAAFYLRGRRLPLMGYLAWGLVALLIPAIGPFIVILCRPGESRRSRAEIRQQGNQAIR